MAYNVGDRVIVISEASGGFKKGSICEVTEILIESSVIVKSYYKNMVDAFSALITPENKYYIITMIMHVHTIRPLIFIDVSENREPIKDNEGYYVI